MEKTGISDCTKKEMEPLAQYLQKNSETGRFSVKEPYAKMITELLKNTGNIYLKQFLSGVFEPYFWMLYDHNMYCDLFGVLEYIRKDGYDISGFGLWEIPTNYIYSFYKKEAGTRINFDIVRDSDKNWKAGCIYHGDEEIVDSIETAIRMHDWNNDL